MCQHPAHQINVSRKGVLCAPDYSKFFGTPYPVGSTLSVVLSGCLTRREINAARIVLFKSTIKLNKFFLSQETQLIIGRLMFNDQ